MAKLKINLFSKNEECFKNATRRLEDILERYGKVYLTKVTGISQFTLTGERSRDEIREILNTEGFPDVTVESYLEEDHHENAFSNS